MYLLALPVKSIKESRVSCHMRTISCVPKLLSLRAHLNVSKRFHIVSFNELIILDSTEDLTT